jgi:hypothetical protein
MERGVHVELIKESATLLARLEWAELDLVLREYGLPTSEQAHAHVGKLEYSIAMLGSVEDETLRALHQYLTGTGEGATGTGPWQPGHLKLFMSHLAAYQDLVGEISGHLAPLGIDAFVAHDSIEPSQEWQTMIEAALWSCDAMVVFLHDRFRESDWCDQEVGFALGRRVPVLPLNYGTVPYGFIGKFQATRCATRSPRDVADLIVEWLARVPTARSALTDAAVWAFENSGSYDSTRRIFTFLKRFENYTPDQLDRLARAAERNSQVRNAVFGMSAVPDLIRKFIVDNGGSGAATSAST